MAKNILTPLGVTAIASRIDGRIRKKIHGSRTAILIILDEEMNDIMKIVQALEGSNILMKGITKSIENETKNEKEDF